MKIDSINKKSMEESKKQWDNIAKPLRGLGILEDLIVKIAGIQGDKNIQIKKRGIVVMCSDNGVVEEKVTQTDQSVTAIVAENFAKGIASVNQMAAMADITILPIDIGIATDVSYSGIRNRKIAYGTKNLAKEPAMTKEQALRAIEIGIQLVKELKEEGYNLLGTGEMGIGNTTTSSAIASVVLNVPVEKVTGQGAGLSNEGIERKIMVIKNALALHQPDPLDPIDVLSKLGGFDIGGLTGVFLGGGMYGVPIIIDGAISAVAALLATKICETTVEYMIPSHLGKEPVSQLVMKELSLTPIIHGELALGEGTGTALLFPLLDMANNVYQQNNTFENIQVPAYTNYDR